MVSQTVVLRASTCRCWIGSFLGLLLVVAPAFAEPIRVTDDAGNEINLPAPARRIISLAPHTAELLFAAGAGSYLVATAEHSDFPPAARSLPRIGGSSGVDVERIVALKPDLIVGWESGNSRRTLDQLRSLGVPLYLSEPRHLGDIARNLEHLGKLAGTEAIAAEEAARFGAQRRALAARYANRPNVRVFYQVLDPLLITINGSHLVSEILHVCGGENIFTALPVLAPAVSEEAVIKANPDAIVAVGTETTWRSWQARWRARTHMMAIKADALYYIPADLLHRHTPRVLHGAERVCVALDDARTKLARVR